MEKDLVQALRQIYTSKQEIKDKYQGRKTILISDMKASSELFAQIGDIDAAAVIQQQRDICLDVITSYNGTGEPIGGDGILAFFDSNIQAVKSTIKIQQLLQTNKISIRIGVHTGEVFLDTHIQSQSIIIASRIMNLADGGQILISSSTYNELEKTDIEFYAHGRYKLKGIPDEIDIYEVLWHKEQKPKKPAISSEQQSLHLNILLLVSRPLISYYDLFGKPTLQPTPFISKVSPLSHKEYEELINSLKDLSEVILNPLPHATVKAFQEALLEQRYDIIHFDGHGLEDGSLCFETDVGELHPLTPDKLQILLENKLPKILFLSACWSKEALSHLKEINIPCIISMKKPISEEAAAKFTYFFYKSLALAHTIKEAFNEAKKSISVSFGRISKEEDIFDISSDNTILNITIKEMK
jgi:class 3 adenylate cyclase